jgi:hypothetical protein
VSPVVGFTYLYAVYPNKENFNSGPLKYFCCYSRRNLSSTTGWWNRSNSRTRYGASWVTPWGTPISPTPSPARWPISPATPGVETGKSRVYGMIYRGPGFRSSDSAPRPPPPLSKLDRCHTGRLGKRGSLLSRETGGRGWAWSRIIRPQESLVLYKSFKTLWVHPWNKNS